MCGSSSGGVGLQEAAGTNSRGTNSRGTNSRETKLSCTHRRALLGRYHRRHAAVAVGLEHALKGAKRQGDGGGGLDPVAWAVGERAGRWGEERRGSAKSGPGPTERAAEQETEASRRRGPKHPAKQAHPCGNLVRSAARLALLPPTRPGPNWSSPSTCGQTGRGRQPCVFKCKLLPLQFSRQNLLTRCCAITLPAAPSKPCCPAATAATGPPGTKAYPGTSAAGPGRLGTLQLHARGDAAPPVRRTAATRGRLGCRNRHATCRGDHGCHMRACHALNAFQLCGMEGARDSSGVQGFGQLAPQGREVAGPGDLGSSKHPTCPA